MVQLSLSKRVPSKLLPQRGQHKASLPNPGPTNQNFRTKVSRQRSVRFVPWEDKTDIFRCIRKGDYCLDDFWIGYWDILIQVDRVAAGLLEVGLEKGDRVAIWAPNVTSWYLSMLGIARCGLISVSLLGNWRETLEGFSFIWIIFIKVSKSSQKSNFKLPGRPKSRLSNTRTKILSGESSSESHNLYWRI